jgi:hypothetical protein
MLVLGYRAYSCKPCIGDHQRIPTITRHPTHLTHGTGKGFGDREGFGKLAGDGYVHPTLYVYGNRHSRQSLCVCTARKQQDQ